jgi:peptidoglycan/xylan/chitin deacetylase (PgdA/CDA1 family)
MRLLALCIPFLIMAAFPSCKRKPSNNSAAPTARAGVAEVNETEVIAPPPVVEEQPNLPEVKNNKSAEIGILCYHGFVTNKAPTAMTIDVGHFRTQMQQIKEAKLPVISLQDFMAWKRGNQVIPDSSVMITIDDGYDSIYHEAAPILQEYGYPYTIFLYKNYVNGGGRALTTSMIKELMGKGATIGSHSVSHPLNIARPGGRSPEEYELFLNRELRDSKSFLEDLFMVPVITYAHPGGTYTKRILELGQTFGYEFMFSVNPAKATFDSESGLIPRYVVLGNDKQDRNFLAALNFRGVGDGELGRQLLGEKDAAGQPLVTVYPAPDSTIAERSPSIIVDVSKLEGVDPNSILVRIAGSGDLAATYHPESRQIKAKIEETLRQPEIFVHVSLMREGSDRPDVLSWKFSINLIEHYLPKTAPVPQ